MNHIQRALIMLTMRPPYYTSSISRIRRYHPLRSGQLQKSHYTWWT